MDAKLIRIFWRSRKNTWYLERKIKSDGIGGAAKEGEWGGGQHKIRQQFDESRVDDNKDYAFRRKYSEARMYVRTYVRMCVLTGARARAGERTDERTTKFDVREPSFTFTHVHP